MPVRKEKAWPQALWFLNPRAFRAVLICLFLWGAIASAFAGPGHGSPWALATAPRVWEFPRDHGSHPAYRTEWWYFTGNLEDAGGSPYGYQLTFFRQGIRFAAPHPENPWSVRDLYFGHLAVMDASAGRFVYDERTSRKGPGLAGARETDMDVWLLDWSARMRGTTILLEARSPEIALRLALAPRKPVVLHGLEGLSRKGPLHGQASYYCSFTDLETSGWLRSRDGGPRKVVSGTSWFDHEFSSSQLSAEQAGWDWFGLHLSDGRDLMIYVLRRKDGRVERESSGTLVERDGRSRHLELPDIRIQNLDHWKSPRNGAEYPCRWRLRIPSAGIDLALEPVMADQELDTQASTGIVYWEGAVAGEGTSEGVEIRCKGYVELTGYAEGIGGLF